MRSCGACRGLPVGQCPHAGRGQRWAQTAGGHFCWPIPELLSRRPGARAQRAAAPRLRGRPWPLEARGNSAGSGWALGGPLYSPILVRLPQERGAIYEMLGTVY